MAIQLELKAKKRSFTGKESARKMRAQGEIPAIIYGKGKENLMISFQTNEFRKMVHGGGHENVMFKIDFQDDSSKESSNVILKEMQLDPVKGHLLHVDFYEISMDQAIHCHVPLLIKGEAVGVKDEGGLLDHHTREILIECLPNDLPEHIEIDVSGLRLGESLHVKDLVYPAGVTPLEASEKVVLAVIHKLKGKEEAEAVVAEAPVEPEVLTKKTSKEEEK